MSGAVPLLPSICVHGLDRNCALLATNQTVVPQAEKVKYLGLHFDKRLTWKNHVTTKRTQLGIKTRAINWLAGKHSPLSLENKLLIYYNGAKTGVDVWN